MRTLYFLVFIMVTSGLAAQADTIFIANFQNASFEENLISAYKHSTLGKGYYEDSIPHWKNEGFFGESPPDLHVNGQNKWGVSQIAYDGEKYIGMVTRCNDTYESISQKLVRPLKPHQEYIFSLKVSRFKGYEMMKPPIPEVGEKPAVLRVWGKNSRWDKEWVELYTSEPIENTDWQELLVSFMPVSSMDVIKIGASWKDGSLFPHNGNILIDDLSPIYLIE